MTTKSELLEFLPEETFGKFVDQINFDKLDKFVSMLVAGYVSRRGQNTVKREIDADATSDTSNFLTHIIEVGSLSVLIDNNMITSNTNENEGALVTVAVAMNISMATALKAKNIYSWDTPVYYDMPSLQTIIGRITNHVAYAMQDRGYVKPLVNNYLLNKI